MKTLGSTIAFTVLILLALGYIPSCPFLTLRSQSSTRNLSITLIARPSSPSLAINPDLRANSSSNAPLRNNTCLNPRIRKEWRALTDVEKEDWIKGVKCLTQLPGKSNINPGPFHSEIPIPYNKSASLYDDFSYVHLILIDYVHQTGFFFPWHRYYSWHFEETLRKHCNYTGSSPYWNWTLDTGDFSHSYMLNNSNPDIGFGNFGDEEHQHAVVDGAFANFHIAYPYPHILRRHFFPYPWIGLPPPWYPDPKLNATEVMTISEIHNTIAGFRNDYRGFQTYIERMQGPHISIHFALGGDMGGYCVVDTPYCGNATLRDPGASPNDPLFWLHHSMMDKIWYDWQHAYDENMYAFSGGSIRDMLTWPKYPVGAPPDLTFDSILPGLGFMPDNLTVKDMFDTTNGLLCYTYE